MSTYRRSVFAIGLFGVLAIALFVSGVGTLTYGQTERNIVTTPSSKSRILVQFRHEISVSRANDIIAAKGGRHLGEISRIGVHIVELPANVNQEAFAHAFASRPDVVFAEPDRSLPPEGRMPNDPLYSKEWHLPKIAAPGAWSSTTGSSSIIIAICDTGVDPTHPDLASKLVPGWNFYDNNSDTQDIYGHGTAVAGTAAANSNDGFGVASVAWGCLIMPIRISAPDGNADISTIAQGMIWAADQGARVVNISYQGIESATLSAAAQYVQSNSGVVTIAAGNHGTFSTAPDDPSILMVSATDSRDNVCLWSNTGNNIDLSAPGADIYTTTNGGGHAMEIGTSFSTPLVAGVAALVFSANPNLTPDQVQNVLKQSADDLGPAGWDSSYGWGRVNAARAVSMALTVGDTTPPQINIVSPSNGEKVSGNQSILVNATDNAYVVKVELYVDGELKATSTIAPFTTRWKTSRAARGVHTLQCVAYDAAGNTGISDIITVNK